MRTRQRGIFLTAPQHIYFSHAYAQELLKQQHIAVAAAVTKQRITLESRKLKLSKTLPLW